MIKHVVCFKLKNNSETEYNKVKELLLSMDGKVTMMRSIEVGTDLLHSPRSFDVFLAVTLDDMDALDAYQKDAYHCDVVKSYMHRAAQESVAVDFEL